MTDRLCDVVIPTRNRPEALRRCLLALADQTSRSFGIIIVDDHSDEPLDGVVEDVLAGATFGIEPTLLRLEQQSGPARARNAGVDASSGKYVIFIDDDVVADRHLVDIHLLEMAATEDSAVPVITRGPFVEPVDWKPNAWNLWEARMATRGTNAILRGDYVPTCQQFHTGNNCMSVALFREAGGFDESYKRLEDDEFGLRLNEMGCTLRFLPSALAWHYSNRSLEAWVAIPRAYAFYTVQLDAQYPSQRYLEIREADRRRSNVLLRAARALLTGRWRTPSAVGFAVGVGRFAHRLRLTPVTMAAMSLAYDLSYTDSLRETLSEPRPEPRSTRGPIH